MSQGKKFPNKKERYKLVHSHTSALKRLIDTCQHGKC